VGDSLFAAADGLEGIIAGGFEEEAALAVGVVGTVAARSFRDDWPHSRRNDRGPGRRHFAAAPDARARVEYADQSRR